MLVLKPQIDKCQKLMACTNGYVLFSVLLLCLRTIYTLDNGIALTPPMGWLAWERFKCNIDCDGDPDNCISENLFIQMADRLVMEGYREAGYRYVNIDDCWMASSRDSNGNMVADEKRFPRGIKFLADYMHERGLRLGIYQDYGIKTCMGFPGIIGHQKQDADTFAKWDVDMVKLDGCNSRPEDMDYGYVSMGELLNKTKKPMLFSCSWPYYQIMNQMEPDYKLISTHCNTWRSFHDIVDDWYTIQQVIDYFGDNQEVWAPYIGPGRWNDPDMLMIGNTHLTVEQSAVQMAVWCILPAPLLMSNDLRKMKAESKRILLNSRAISVNQDRLGKPGKRIFQSCIVPSNDAISLRPEVTAGEVNSRVRSAYVQRFSQDPKPIHQNISKWNRIVQNFLSSSTLHGVSHLRPPCSRPQKCFWLFAILSCGTFFLVHATVLVYNALTRPSLSTTLTLKYRDLDGPLLKDYDKITNFPGITVCGLTPFKRQETEDSLSSTMYHALSLGYPYSGLTLEERINLHEAITKPEEIADSINTTLAIFKQKLKQFTKDSGQKVNISEILWENSYKCEDVFSRCSVGFETLNCCAMFVPILTTFGYCFALKVNKNTLGTFEMETLPFVIDLHVPESNTTDSEEGYLLLVHDPRFSPRMILPKDGFLVAPGVTMSLRLTLRITDYSAKYARWFGLVTDCPKVACMDEDYSIQECIFQNAASKIKDACNCTWILDECKSGSKEVPVCGPKKMTECVIIKATQILSDLLKKCQPPCLEYIFEAASSYAQLRYNYSLQERSRIAISYNTISYYHNIYHKHYLSSLFSDIGGAMGLLLGASCLTGVELLTFLGQWIYFTFLEKI